MCHKKLKLFVVFLLVFETATLNAQTSISSSGGIASGSGGSASYSIGQAFYTKYSGTNGSVAQGVQQPFEISVLTEIKDVGFISPEFSVYPNPATDFLRLKTGDYEIENLRYQLYDINGNILLSNKVEENETNISMQNFIPATYFLKLIHGNKEIKAFKIIKN